MSLFGMMQISGSALTAERRRAEVVAANLANAETTHTAAGGAYRRKLVVLTDDAPPENSFSGAMVQASEVVDDPSPLARRYEPWHPDAGPDGYVEYPNVNPAEEMADLMSADRSYQLNATAIQTAKAMLSQALEIGK